MWVTWKYLSQQKNKRRLGNGPAEVVEAAGVLPRLDALGGTLDEALRIPLEQGPDCRKSHGHSWCPIALEQKKGSLL